MRDLILEEDVTLSYEGGWINILGYYNQTDISIDSIPEVIEYLQQILEENS